LKIEKEPTTRPQSEIEIFIFARLDEKFFLLPLRPQRKIYALTLRLTATLSAPLRRPLTINHNIKAEGGRPLTVGHFCPNAPLRFALSRARQVVRLSLQSLRSCRRFRSVTPFEVRLRSQSKGRLTINRWGIYSATVGVRGLDKTLAFARSGTPARLSRLNPPSAGTHASIRGTPPLRFRGRDLVTGGLRGKKRFAFLLFFKKNFEVKNVS
jgi:hypothetical protein